MTTINGYNVCVCLCVKKSFKIFSNPKFDEFIMKSTLNASVVMTFFRILNSRKTLLKQQRLVGWLGFMAYQPL